MRWSRLRIPVLLLAFSLPSGAALSAQEIVPLREGCPACAVSVERLVTLGGEDEGFVGEPLAFSRLTDGRWLVSSTSAAEYVSVFRSDGEFIERVGGPGEGPGEFQHASAIITVPGDSVLVYDGFQRRVTWLDPALDVVRTEPMPPNLYPTYVLRRGDGAYIVAGSAPEPERAAFPLHIVIDGRINRSIGAASREYRRGDRAKRVRVPALSADGAFYLAHMVRYRVERWDSAGNRLRVWERDVEWFEPHDGPVYGRREIAPKPLIVGLAEDAEGRIWVALRVPDEAWREALEFKAGDSGQEGWWPSSPDAYWDTLLEVIEPNSGIVLASVRMDGVTATLAEAPSERENGVLTTTYREKDALFPRVDIWCATLSLSQEEDHDSDHARRGRNNGTVDVPCRRTRRPIGVQ